MIHCVYIVFIGVCAVSMVQAASGGNRLRNPFFLPIKNQNILGQNISIKLIGMVYKQQKAGAIVVYGAEKKQKVVGVGDSVAGFRVATIADDQLILQKKKKQLVLHMTS